MYCELHVSGYGGLCLRQSLERERERPLPPLLSPQTKAAAQQPAAAVESSHKGAAEETWTFNGKFALRICCLPPSPPLPVRVARSVANGRGAQDSITSI